MRTLHNTHATWHVLLFSISVLFSLTLFLLASNHFHDLTTNNRNRLCVFSNRCHRKLYFYLLETFDLVVYSIFFTFFYILLFFVRTRFHLLFYQLRTKVFIFILYPSTPSLPLYISFFQDISCMCLYAFNSALNVL